MNKGSSGIYDRCLEKTSEQSFIGALRREFELSPAASMGIPKRNFRNAIIQDE